MGGATCGAITAPPGYFRAIREVCDRHGILLILDEVMCGMGRTGTLHACEQEGVAPDLMTIAKGLGGGFAPIGAVMVADRVFQAFDRGSKLFQHGHTYLGHPLACAAGLAVQKVIKRDDLLANVRAQGAHLSRRLGEAFGNHHHVGDIRGAACSRPSRSSRTAEARSPSIGPEVACTDQGGSHGPRAHGLSVGWHGRRDAGGHVLIAPPFIVDAQTIDTIVERLAEAVDASLARPG